jgi:hypothetical protein
MTISKQLFRIAGGSSFAVSVFQAVISFVPSWSLHFGAPEELVANTTMLITAGLIAAIIFAIFGLYALAGAGDIQTLPLLRIGLLGIGGVYTIRGIVLIPQLLIMWEIIQSTETISSTMLASSLISLITGILYFLGIVVGWRNLQPNTKS